MDGLSSAQRGTQRPGTFREFMERMLAAFPDAEVSEDAQGQLVIYTNLVSLHDDEDDDRSTVVTLDEFYPFVDTDADRRKAYEAMRMAQYDVDPISPVARATDDPNYDEAEQQWIERG